jgi:hypothetical protein
MSLPARQRIWAARFINTGLFVLAGLMCFSFLYTSIEPIVIVAAISFVTSMRLAAGAVSSGRLGMRAFGWFAWLWNGAFHLLVSFLAMVWASTLAWSMSWWSIAISILLFAGALATFRRPSHRVRVPIALPVGVVILTCMLGWRREEGFARCDDYRRAEQQRGVEVMFPPVDQLVDCSPGDVIPIGRFARKIWESPDSRRYVITTTTGSSGAQSGIHASAGVYNGLFCEVSADGSGRPHCLGGMQGKAHQIDEIEPLGQLFSCAWGLSSGDGRHTSAIYRLSRDAPLTILGEHRIEDAFVMYGFYQPKTDEYHAFTDECGPIRTVRASDFSPLPDLPVANCPGATVYDAARDEGVMCGGKDGGFAAFRLMPWSYRFIGTTGNRTRRLWMSWGCDWDPVGRKVYATVPNIGLLAVIDYDTSRLERAHFVGFALRSVAFDARRRRVYLADFLGGDVLAVDVSSGAEVKRWFVGHFIRELRISHDGNKLLSTSNLGIIRIDLEAD